MYSENFPILTTERLILRPLTLEDQHAVFNLRSNPKINTFLNRKPCESLEEAKNFIHSIHENITKGDTYYWGICFANTKQLVGTICLFDFSVENNSCEIGYELMPDFQKQGIMQEAIQIVIPFVFHTLQLNKIIAYTHIENQNSTNLLLKFNFREAIELNNENPNLIIYSLTL